MNRRAFLVLSAVLLALAVPARAAEILVFAAASLTDALKEAAAGYEKASGGGPVRFNFAASNTLAQQIRAGAPADVFFSADAAQMDALERAGRIAGGTRREVVGNALVIVVPRGRPVVRQPADLAGPAVRRLSLGNPQAVPAGVYARRWLETAGLWEAVRGKVVPAENVRAALAVVASGNAEAGIVYRTDAAVSGKVAVACAVPASEAPVISYPAAVVADSRQAAEARRFVEWLGTEAAAEIFRRHGFTAAAGK